MVVLNAFKRIPIGTGWRGRRVAVLLVVLLLVTLSAPAQTAAVDDQPIAVWQSPLQQPASFGPFAPKLWPIAPPLEHKLKKFSSKYDLAKIGHRGIGNGLNFFSLNSEEHLGKEMAEQVERQSKMMTDPFVTEYVNRIGQNLARSSDLRAPLTVKIIDTDQINALSLPGGIVYVTTELILQADDEAALAGVMAHEIGHISARHGTRTYSKSIMWMIALSVPAAMVASSGGRLAGRATLELSSMLVDGKLSRDAEHEADLLAVQYVYASGYDPASYVQFFEKVTLAEKKKPSLIGRAFASHPPTDDRIHRCQEEINDYLPMRESYLVTSSEFDEMKARLMSILNRRSVEKDSEMDAPVLRKSTKSTNEETP